MQSSAKLLWLSKIEGNYALEVDVQEPKNQFVDIQFHITDPHGRGLGFVIGFNKKGFATFLAVDDGDIGRFNVAEDYTPSDITKVAEEILSWSGEHSKTIFFKRPMIAFETSRGKITLKLQRDSGHPYDKKAEAGHKL